MKVSLPTIASSSGTVASPIYVAQSKFDTPLFPLVIAFVLGALIVLQGLSRSNFNPTVFVGADARWADPRVLGSDFIVDANSGYDGQFYYRLARNPWTSTRTAHGITLDVPAYRHQRILYPFLAWCLSLRQASWTPWTMIAVNLLAFCALGWLGGLWANFFGEHALWGALPLFHVGFTFSLLGNLGELVQIVCLLAGLLLVEKKRYGVAAVWLSLAVLAKETALLPAIVVAGVVGWQHLFASKFQKQNVRDQRVLWLFAPLGVYIVGQLILLLVWGEMPLSQGRGNLNWPFVVIFSYFFLGLQGPGDQIARNIGLLSTLIYVGLVLFYLRNSRASFSVKLAWLLTSVFFVSLGEFVLSVDVHFMRVFSECFVLGALILMTVPIRPRFALLLYLAFFNILRNTMT